MVRPEALGAALDAVLALLVSGRGSGSAEDPRPGGAPARAPQPGDRTLVGITGPPGAGKSTLAAALVEALCERLPAAGTHPAVVVPMDGFHLANTELRRLGLTHRKGSPQTFDAAGFVHLLGRLRRPGTDVVYAPAYSRRLHESIGGAIPVQPEVRVVVVEGNYLLLDDVPWSSVPSLLDLLLYLDAPEQTRRDGLLRRQLSRGLDPAAARDWVDNSDEVNARLVAATRDRADLVLYRGA